MTNNLCRIPIKATMVKNPVTGEWEMDAAQTVWADIPADVIARKLISGFGLDAILKGGDAD